MRSKTVVICLLVLANCAEVGRCDDQVEPELASAVLHRLLHERERIRSGRVEFTGKHFSRYGQAFDYQDARIEGVHEFDALTRSYRYEHSRDCRVRVYPPGDRSLPDPDDIPELYPVRYLACRNADYFTEWVQEGVHAATGLSLKRPEVDTREVSGSCRSHAFDPLVAGMITQHHWIRGKELGFVHELVSGLKVVRITEQSGVADLYLEDDAASYHLVVDTQRNVPARFDYNTIDGVFEFQSQAEWSLSGDLLVPTAFSWTLGVDGGEFSGQEGESYVFKWSRVNEVMSGDEFKYTAFRGLKGMSDVIDDRGAEPQYLGHLQEDGTLVNRISPPVNTVTAAQSAGGMDWLVWLNLAVVLLVVAFVVRRRLARQSQ